MYNEILNNLQEQLELKEWLNIKDKTLHLGIFTEPYLTYILEGKKRVESRFSKKKIAPYEKIKKEDIVLVKKSGGNILAYFTIKEVLFFDLQNISIEKIKARYNKELCVNDTFWENKKESKYATLIVIDQIIKLKPFPINKKGMQTWIPF